MPVVFTDAYRPPQSPFYQLPPKVQHYPSSQLLLSPTPPGLQQLLGELMKTIRSFFFICHAHTSCQVLHTVLDPVKLCIQNMVYFHFIKTGDLKLH